MATQRQGNRQGNTGAERAATPIHGPQQQPQDDQQDDQQENGDSSDRRQTIEMARIHGTEDSARAESDRVREHIATLPEKQRPKKPYHVYRATLADKTRFVIAESPQRVASLTFREFGMSIIDLDTGRGSAGYDPAAVATHMSDAEIAAAIAAMQEIVAQRNQTAAAPAAQTQRSAARGR
jgi:hypothetical protein